ncbi:MAG: M20/M25/M40 family metallo-hydrolase [Planctomycetes bacterium]|nr:M20/M25/M40 family metallo-hydrolase [Planctomycetota bacterium]
MPDLRDVCQAAIDQVVDFCRHLIRFRSLPGQEAEIAAFVRDKLEALGYDRVEVDGAGNVLGHMKGSDPSAASVMLNSHLDVVDAGDPAGWPCDPWSGEVRGDRIYGRGASDTKGALAVQAYAPVVLRRAGLRPHGDCTAAFVVFEELGGSGTRYLVTHGSALTDLAILGEATSNEIRTGHRGARGVVVVLRGRMAHASVPAQGVNPHYTASRFLLELERSLGQLPCLPVLGPSSIAPTLYETDNRSRNVIPGEVRLTLDWRTTAETDDGIVSFLQGVAQRAGVEIAVKFSTLSNRTYTGYQEPERPRRNEKFLTPADHPAVRTAARVIEEELGRKPGIRPWNFCTDGYILAGAGVTTFGFSPCEEHLAHTNDDHVKIPMMLDGLRCTARMLLELGSGSAGGLLNRDTRRLQGSRP